MPLRDNCRDEDGLLYLDDRLVIPEDIELRQSLIAMAHVELGHLGTEKTTTYLCNSFYWRQMGRDVDGFVRGCETCQRIKSQTTATQGRM